jgi:hypothetical protein
MHDTKSTRLRQLTAGVTFRLGRSIESRLVRDGAEVTLLNRAANPMALAVCAIG